MSAITVQPKSRFSTTERVELVELEEGPPLVEPYGYKDDLNALDNTNFLSIQEQMDFDIKAGCGSGNTYQIKDKEARKLFYAVEDANCLCRWCCGPHRMFHVTIYNLKDEAVLHLDRACCRCDWCCCLECCLCQHHLTVSDAYGDIIGRVRQRFHIFNLALDLTDQAGERFQQIKGPCCPCRCCTEMNFDILSKNGDRGLGYIFKRWAPHHDNKVNMDHENFDIHFPSGVDIKQKAVILGAAFLVDFMYFEVS